MNDRQRLAIWLFALAGAFTIIGFALMPERFGQMIRDLKRGPT